MFNFGSTSTEEYDWDWDEPVVESTSSRVEKLEQDLYGSMHLFACGDLGLKKRVENIEDALKSHKERIKALENYLGIEFKNAPEIGSYEEIENDK